MRDESYARTQTEAKALAEDILADMELNRIPLANVAMKCARLARLLVDEKAMLWFRCEIGGYPLKDGVVTDRGAYSIAVEIGRLVDKSEKSEKEKNSQIVWTDSLSTLDARIDLSRAELTGIQLPSSLAEGSSSNPLANPGNAISGIVTTVLKRRTEFIATISRETRLIGRIRASMYQWALDTSHLLRFGTIPADAFQTAKSLVDDYLRRISPDALQKFAAAQQRAISGATEEWSQALLSLRRMLKDLANALYPPTDKEIDGHKLGEENYVNRLWQFVKERAAGDRETIVASEVEYVGQRIEALHDLACKGTHAAVSREEVDLIVVHIYLLAADLLSMLPAKERAHLVETQAPAPAAPSSGARPVQAELPST